MRNTDEETRIEPNLFIEDKKRTVSNQSGHYPYKKEDRLDLK